MKRLPVTKVEFISGGNHDDKFFGGVKKALDDASRGAFIGGTIGWVGGPGGAAMGAVAGAVYGTGIGLMDSLGDPPKNNFNKK